MDHTNILKESSFVAPGQPSFSSTPINIHKEESTEYEMAVEEETSNSQFRSTKPMVSENTNPSNSHNSTYATIQGNKRKRNNNSPETIETDTINHPLPTSHNNNNNNKNKNTKSHPDLEWQLQDTQANIGRYSPIAFAKKIREITPGPLTMSTNGQNSVKINCQIFSDANLILDYFTNNLTNYITSVPSSLFYKKGFIKNVEIDINLSELYQHMDDYAKPIIIGLKRRTNIEKGPIDIVELIFNTSTIPRTVKIYDLLFQITPIIPNPVRCYYCQRFRHTADQCRSSHPVCEFCSLHHIADQCLRKLETPKCSNCEDNHLASSNTCLRYKYEFQLSKIFYVHNIGFQDAIIYLNSKGIYTPKHLHPIDKEKTPQQILNLDPRTSDAKLTSNLQFPGNPYQHPSRFYSKRQSLDNLVNNLLMKLTKLNHSYND